jgi:hypothetical protein
MNSNSGKVIYRKFTAKSGPESINGKRAVTKIMKMIIMLNAIIRCLIFTGNTPIITIGKMIKESGLYVNDAAYRFY